MNREARSIALPWIREQGISLRFTLKAGLFPVNSKPVKQRCLPRLERSFEVLKDAMLIRNQKDISALLIDPIERQEQPDMVDSSADIDAKVVRIAMTEALLRKVGEGLGEVFWYFFHLRELLVIFDSSPAVENHSVELGGQGISVEGGEELDREWKEGVGVADADGKARQGQQGRGMEEGRTWDFEDEKEKGRYVWNGETRLFRFEGDKETEDQVLRTVVGDAMDKGFGEGLERSGIKRFEIRGVRLIDGR